MARYNYKAYDMRGALVEGEVPAATRDTALEVLARKGYLPFELGEAGAGDVKWWRRELFETGRLSLESLGLFTRELASLVGAHLPLDEALRIIAVQPMLPRRLKAAVRTVQSRVIEGDSLSEALAAQGQAFPEYYWRLVGAGEAGGSLESALGDLANFLEASAAMRGRVTSALIYPAILVVAAMIAVGIVMSVLVPAIAPLFAEAKAPLPLLIGLLIDADAFLRSYGLVILGAIAACAIAIAAANASAPAFRRALDRNLLRLPIFGRIIERRETGRLARTLATLIKNGVPIVEAMRISGSVLSNRAIAGAVLDASKAIQQGESLSAPLARSGVLSDLFVRLAAIGEQTGELDVLLIRAADIYDSALARQMQRLASLITPIATVVIGVVVGGLILSVMSALLSINDLALK